METLSAFLARAQLSKRDYEARMIEQGYDDVDYLRQFANAEPDKLKATMKSQPINMLSGHVEKLVHFLTLKEAPSAPMVLADASGGDSDDSDDSDEDDVEILVHWGEGCKFTVNLSERFDTVGELLEHVREVAQKEGCKGADTAHPEGVDDWALLNVPHYTNKPEKAKLCGWNESLERGHANGAYEALAAMPKHFSADVTLQDKGSRRQMANLPSAPYFSCADDNRVAICHPDHKHLDYDTRDDSTRLVGEDQAELRFYLKGIGAAPRGYHVDVAKLGNAVGEGENEWKRVRPNRLRGLQPGAAQRIIVSGLSPDTEYKFRIRTVGDRGLESHWACGLTSARTAPGSEREPEPESGPEEADGPNEPTSFPRPSGRAPKNKVWDSAKGEWRDDPAAAAAAAASPPTANKRPREQSSSSTPKGKDKAATGNGKQKVGHAEPPKAPPAAAGPSSQAAGGAASSSSSGGGGGEEAELEKLKSWLDRGLITEEMWEEKVKAILDRSCGSA